MNNFTLKQLGLNDVMLCEAAMYPDLYVGRVTSQHKELYKVLCEKGELLAEVSGKLRFETKGLSDYPAVGDFVMIDRDDNMNGNAVIRHRLSRKSAFVRKSAGKSGDEQIVASNIDVVFICMSLNRDFNLRRLERYLAISWDSGATPVVVLTKADLCDDIDKMTDEVETVAVGADIVVTSSISEDGYLTVMNYIKKEQTIAFIGSSGVGKSTLINRLIGEGKLETRGIRNDDKGRHTTTSRELIMLDNGSMVIDTPGMRELGIESADVSKAFADVDELALKCKFNDCTHTSEPGCKVSEAIKNGVLSPERLRSYNKLKKEAKYEELNSKQIEAEKIKEMFSSFGGMKNARAYLKEKTKNKR